MAMGVFLAACSTQKKEDSADKTVKLEELKTPAEESEWERTTSSKEVLEYCKTVADNSGGRIILDDTTFKTEAGTPIRI